MDFGVVAIDFRKSPLFFIFCFYMFVDLMNPFLVGHGLEPSLVCLCVCSGVRGWNRLVDEDFFELTSCLGTVLCVLVYGILCMNWKNSSMFGTILPYFVCAFGGLVYA